MTAYVWPSVLFTEKEVDDLRVTELDERVGTHARILLRDAPEIGFAPAGERVQKV
jgi:hypothetical protein